MEIFLGWLIFSLVVGFVGSNRKIGFWGAFFLSLLLSPIIGLIIALVSKNIEDEEYKEQILKAQQKQQVALSRMTESKSITNTKTSIIEELEKLKKLKDDNIVTEEEFLNLKKKVLDSGESIVYAKLEKLSNGEILQYVNEIDSSKNPEVRVNDNLPSDGFYKLYNRTFSYKITDGKISKKYFIFGKKQKDGSLIEIGSINNDYQGVKEIGNPVWVNGKTAPNGGYKIGFMDSIIVVNGVIGSFH